MQSDQSELEPLFKTACPVCSFKLRDPISSLGVSDLVLNNDSRFRGRCILALRKHYDSWEDVPAELAHQFTDDTQRAVRAIRKVTGCARVNIAILGNAVPHIHAHLIPRYPAEEADPNRAPWRDQRPELAMDPEATQAMILAIKGKL